MGWFSGRVGYDGEGDVADGMKVLPRQAVGQILDADAPPNAGEAEKRFAASHQLLYP